jgi:FolB domain-containing protein
MDKILIQNLKIKGILGVNERERINPRLIVVNLILHTDSHPASLSDDIKDCVDYSLVAKSVKILVEKATRFTIEALAEDVANLCLDFHGVKEVTIRVEKPGALKNAKTVGVEIERFN